MKVLRWLDRHLEESLMVFLLAGMVIFMTMQIFMRYALSASLPWPEELIRYLFIWFVFLGISYAIREGIHLRVDIIEILIPALKKPLNVLQDIMFFVFLIYMIKPSITAIRALIRSGQLSAAMEMPMWIVYLSLLVGIFLSIFRMIQVFILKYYYKVELKKSDKETGE